MEYTGAFEKFVTQRRDILDRSEQLGGDLDAWIEAYGSLQAPMTELARLESLLKQRRDCLDELMALDESFIDYLVKHRTAS